jgi:hypothetical protein
VGILLEEGQLFNGVGANLREIELFERILERGVIDHISGA